MTQEDKQLLLADLCARLMYGVKAQYYGSEEEMLTVDTIEAIYTQSFVEIVIGQYGLEIKNIKPYLRPMSSMTEEESVELSKIIGEWFDKELFYLTEEPFLEYALSKINYTISPLLFDWLNKKMFDYRGLIPKGLAISTEEFNPYKD